MRRSNPVSISLDSWHPYALIILAILLVYAGAAFFGFTWLDDKDLIVDNQSVISRLSNIPQVFSSRVFPNLLAPYYRPILIVTFMLDYKIAGPDPAVYHVTNMLIHALVCCMIFRILVRLGYARPASLFFSMFFAVHPALVQAVAWIPGRNDSLLALFSLASFIFFINYLESGRRSDVIWHIVFFALGLFTKETAIMIPAVCLLYHVLVRGKTMRPGWARPFVFGWFAVSVLWYAMRESALKGSFESSPDSLAMSLWASLPAFLQYIGKIVMPFNLSVFPIMKDTAYVYGVSSAILIGVALFCSREKRMPLVAFGLCWFFLFLAPAFLRPSVQFVHDFQEHRMYLPMIGMIIVFNEIDFFKKMQRLGPGAALCAAALCVLAALNFRHADNFKDRLSYWTNAINSSPGSWLTHLKAASIFYDEGQLDKAESEYKKVLDIDRVSSPAYAGLGHIYMDRGRLNDAEAQFKRALAAYPANYPAAVSLGALYYKQGRLNEASGMWLYALGYEPSDERALKNMAILCVEQNDMKAARFYVDRLRKTGARIPQDFLKKLEGG